MQISDVETETLRDSTTAAAAADAKNDASEEVAIAIGKATRRSKRLNSCAEVEAEENKVEDDEPANPSANACEKTTNALTLSLAEAAAKAALEDERNVASPTAPLLSSSASTPRRKRADTTLANLHSNLSPKYIGFVTPPFSVSPLTTDTAVAVSAHSAERKRSSRRHQLNPQHSSEENGAATPPAAPTSTTKIVGPCIRRTITNTAAASPTELNMTTPLRQKQSSFVSPIDKLLLKNGSTSPAAASIFESFETSAPTVAVAPTKSAKMHASPTSYSQRKTRSQIMAQAATIAALSALPEPIDLEAMIPSVVIVQPQLSPSLSTPIIDEEIPIPQRDATEISNVQQQPSSSLPAPGEEDEIPQQDENELANVQHILADHDIINYDKDEVHIEVADEVHLEIADGVHLEVTDDLDTEEIPADAEILLFKYDEDPITEEEVVSLEVDKTASPKKLAAASEDADKTILHSEEEVAESKTTSQNGAGELAQEILAEEENVEAADAVLEELPIIVIDDDDEEELQQTAEVEAEAEAHVDIEIDDGAATNANLSAAAAKSPSAVSMDSAQGSSVVSDAAWMSFTIGDLFWGQLYNYCYWPCMVCPDPEGKTITTTEATVLRTGTTNQHLIVHVRFFADNARRNWVKRENLFPFLGLENHEARAAEALDKYGKKSHKYKQLVPQKSQRSTWFEAIKEANIVAEILHAERLEKFYEIYEKSKAFLKNHRKRRPSLLGGSTPTSDMGSLYDSTDNLHQALAAATKRDRSMSPFSPAFSPVKAADTTKRRKLSTGSNSNNNNNNNKNDKDESNFLLRTPTTTSRQQQQPHQQRPNGGYDLESMPASQSSSSSTTTAATASPHQDSELFSDGDFRKFYFSMKDFVMADNKDEELERQLIVAVRNIWGLKQINQTKMQRQLAERDDDDNAPLSLLGSSLVERSSGSRGRPSDGAYSLKRLSNRLKNIVKRPSLPDAAALKREALEARTKSTAMSVAMAPPAKKPLNRPIEEVINDIFNLDSKYLFKGLGRDPVCKYCHKHDANVVRCSKGACQSWLHAGCIGKSFNETQSINGKRTVRRSKTVAFEDSIPSEDKQTTSSQASIITHITADEDPLEEVAPVASAVAPVIDEIVVCAECAHNKPAACAVCGDSNTKTNTATNEEEEIVFCSMPHCGKAYHPACCKYWPQAKITKSKNIIESFRCPSHVCHTCVSDDPKGKFQHLNSAKLTKCVRCPASYHTDSTCIPAGSQILTAAHIICPRHNGANASRSSADMHINVSWCFICVGGGQLVCCETCPTAVHAACLNIPISPDAGYICEECESGRMPLYGEMVWAKFNSFRWWPAIILPPTEVPQNIMRKTHQPSEFVVRFFGTHDHGWISRRRVYLYIEGDSSEPPKSKSHLDLSYNRGVEEAKQIYEIVKLKKQTQRLSNESKEKLHPQPYVRIKANRAVPPVRLHSDMELVNKCECDADAPDPCGPDSNCLNRVLYHECNPKLCPAGERCQNQMFESRISPRLDVFYTKERGFGLVCLEFIATGTFVIEYVGEIINDDEFRQRMQQKSSDRDENFYFLSVEKDYIIDAGPKGNLARFMNHSCDPNCETQKWSVNGLNRVGLFAIKDIMPNTELTFNYHWDELLGSEKKTCFCGAAKCAGQIGEKYKQDKVVKGNTDFQSKTKGRPAKKSAKPVKRLLDKISQQKSKKKKQQKLRIQIASLKSSPLQAKTKKGREKQELNASATE